VWETRDSTWTAPRRASRLGDDVVPLLAAVPDLKGTAITDEGLAELRAAKPKA